MKLRWDIAQDQYGRLNTKREEQNPVHWSLLNQQTYQNSLYKLYSFWLWTDNIEYWSLCRFYLMDIQILTDHSTKTHFIWSSSWLCSLVPSPLITGFTFRSASTHSSNGTFKSWPWNVWEYKESGKWNLHRIKKTFRSQFAIFSFFLKSFISWENRFAIWAGVLFNFSERAEKVSGEEPFIFSARRISRSSSLQEKQLF